MPGMIMRTYRAWQEAPDRVLIKELNRLLASNNIHLVANDYLHELSRRETKQLTKTIRCLTAANTVLVFISTIFVIVSVFR